jgi:hypothetical protein
MASSSDDDNCPICTDVLRCVYDKGGRERGFSGGSYNRNVVTFSDPLTPPPFNAPTAILGACHRATTPFAPLA